jgi:glycine C-acetyltransferase
MATTTTHTNPLSYLTDQLNDLKQKGTYFKLRVLEDEQAPVCTFDGKKVINLASNNYLGLTTHPKLREAALSGGPGSCWPPAISPYSPTSRQ